MLVIESKPLSAISAAYAEVKATYNTHASSHVRCIILDPDKQLFMLAGWTFNHSFETILVHSSISVYKASIRKNTRSQDKN